MINGVDNRLEETSNFDLRRLTIMGWLLVLVSVGLFIWAMIWFTSTSLPPGVRLSKGATKFYGVIGFVICIGFFLGCRWSLECLGLQVVRPLLQTNDETES